MDDFEIAPVHKEACLYHRPRTDIYFEGQCERCDKKIRRGCHGLTFDDICIDCDAKCGVYF